MESKKFDSFMKNKEKLIIGLGIAGMLLIFLSSFPMDTETDQPKQDTSTAQYSSSLEKQLETTLGAIEGVGKVKVMLTLEGSTQSIYAQDEKNSIDEQMEYSSDQLERAQKKQDSENKHIFVDGSNRQALKIQEIEPRVKGVVIVCQGAASPVVTMRVTEAVTTLLAINSNQVCVALYADK